LLWSRGSFFVLFFALLCILLLHVLLGWDCEDFRKLVLVFGRSGVGLGGLGVLRGAGGDWGVGPVMWTVIHSRLHRYAVGGG